MSTPLPPPGLPPPEALLKGEKEGQAVVIWTVGMFCIFGWDYLMNLPTEIERIWKKKITYTSVLYLLNRYYGLVQFALVVPLITTPITNAFSVDACKHIFRWEPVGALISTLLSQVIMGSRVYALYGKSTYVAGILGNMLLIQFIFHAYTMTRVFQAPAPAPGIPVPCIAIGPQGILVAFWVLPLVYDTVTFSLTLFKAVSLWRNETKSPTLSLLFRDGLVYFAAIFSMNLINVILFVTQSTTLQAVNLPATLMLNIIMSCRLVLNLRAPQSVVTFGGSPAQYPLSSEKGGKTLPLWTTPPHPANFLDLSSQQSQGTTVITAHSSSSAETKV